MAKKIYRLLYVRRDVDMDKKIKYRITNIDELVKKLKKAQALSEELASVLKEIDEFKAKIRFDEWRIFTNINNQYINANYSY